MPSSRVTFLSMLVDERGSKLYRIAHLCAPVRAEKRDGPD